MNKLVGVAVAILIGLAFLDVLGLSINSLMVDEVEGVSPAGAFNGTSAGAILILLPVAVAIGLLVMSSWKKS